MRFSVSYEVHANGERYESSFEIVRDETPSPMDDEIFECIRKDSAKFHGFGVATLQINSITQVA